MDICPKCGYQRQPKDADPFVECPHCGIVFAKYAKYHAEPAAPAEAASDIEITMEDPIGPWYLRLLDRLMELPEKPDQVKTMAQAVVLAVMVVWGVQLIADKWVTAEIMYSFLHKVDLPIHEFGHILFSPFSEWMMYLGGSLFQCLLPALIGVVFIWKQRDPFGAAFCLWWTAENVLDVAPYIGDARLMALPLTGEWNEDVAEAHVARHDWHNILDRIGMLDSDRHLAAFAHGLGATLMVLAWVWAGVWLWKSWQKSREDPFG
jgi:hypothetical protein